MHKPRVRQRYLGRSLFFVVGGAVRCFAVLDHQALLEKVIGLSKNKHGMPFYDAASGDAKAGFACESEAVWKLKKAGKRSS